MIGKLYKIVPLGAAFVGLAVALLSVGCGSGNARFRFVLGSTGATTNVDMQIDGRTVLTNIGFGAGASYQGTSSGNHTFEIFQTGTTTNPFFDGTLTLSSGDNTLVSSNVFSNTAFTITVFADNNTLPASGGVKLRIINASSTVGSVDVYVFQPPATIQGDPTIAGVQYKTASSYLPIAAGNYEVTMTQAGTLNPIQGLDDTYSLTAGQIRTLVILDSPSGGGPYRQLVLNDLN
jgi:Domain of unknown function (DUF4397)